MSLSWESDGGVLAIYRDLTKPIVKFLTPPTAAAAAVIKIYGTNFVGVTAVKFGATAATTFVVDSGRQITATVPAGTGTVAITVTNAQGISTTSAASSFLYV
jgi:hypothetical protein